MRNNTAFKCDSVLIKAMKTPFLNTQLMDHKVAYIKYNLK